MNVYIVDDRPQTLLSLVAQMVKNGFHVQTVFVYFERKEDADNRKVKTLENQFTALGVTLRIITDNDFHTVLDEIYMDPNAVFLFDFDLSPERSFYCDERINVQYALGKLQLEPDNFKIWFYTTGPVSMVAQIHHLFGDRLISVERFDSVTKQFSLDLPRFGTRYCLNRRKKDRQSAVLNQQCSSIHKAAPDHPAFCHVWTQCSNNQEMS